jgi:hypothetical protein
VLQLAAEVAGTAAADRLATLLSGLLVAADADWAVALRDGELLHDLGAPPELGWLVAFLDGSEHLDPTCPNGSAPADVMWAHLPTTRITVAAGRSDRAVHERERVRITLLARIVDALL